MPVSGQLQTKEPWFVVSLSLLCHCFVRECFDAGPGFLSVVCRMLYFYVYSSATTFQIIIWSSIVLFRGEIVIIQVFDEDISSLAIAKTVKIMLLPNVVDKISMTSLL